MSLILDQTDQGARARTLPFNPPDGSAFDPTVEEVTWRAWELRSAEPEGVGESVLHAVTAGFDLVAETAWIPGRAVLISELEWLPNPGRGCDGDQHRPQGQLAVRFAVGCFGPRGTTDEEVGGLEPVITGLLHDQDLPYVATDLDPVALLDRDPIDGAGPRVGEATRFRSHALIRQRTVEVPLPGGRTIDVVSRFNPTVEPWGVVARRLSRLDVPVRVRATLMATEFSPFDRSDLGRAIGEATAVANHADTPPDLVFQAERANLTLLALQSSFASPLFIGELAVSSTDRLPETFLRLVATAFTSEIEVTRRGGHVAVASAQALLGGFGLEQDPADLHESLRLGVPLRGGIGPRSVADLLTLAQNPIGWPVPFGRPIPGVTPGKVSLTVPHALEGSEEDADDRTVLGRIASGEVVALPHQHRVRHVVLTGGWGSGKSTAMVHLIHDDLRHERGALFIDPHGDAADRVVALARDLGRDVVVFDARDPEPSTVSPFDHLRRGSGDLVDAQISAFLNALVSYLPKDYASVRWFSIAESLCQLQAAARVGFDEALSWLQDRHALQRELNLHALPALAESTLRTVVEGNDGDVRNWVASKFHVLARGALGRLFLPPGEGPTMGDLVNRGGVVVVNMAGLSTGEGLLFGHLWIEAAVAALLARPAWDRDLFTIYLDEAHRFPGVGQRRGLAEGRKFGLAMVLAAQSLAQFDAELSDLALAAGTHLFFRATPATTSNAAAHLGLDPHVLRSLPDLTAMVAVQGLDPVRITIDPYP